MDPQNANPSGQPPEGTVSNNNNAEVEVDLSSPQTEQSPSADSAATAPAPADVPAPEPQVQTEQPLVAPAPDVSGQGVPSQTPVATQPVPTVDAAPSSNAQPGMIAQEAPSVFVGSATQSMEQIPPSPMSAPSGSKKRWIMPLVIVIVLLAVITGGYVFAVYLPSTPNAIYQTSLKETGSAIDTLINYSNSASAKDYKSYAVSGSISSTGTTSFNATLSGSGDTSGDAKLTMSADIMGEKLNANVDTVHVSGSSTPDVYLQATGLKPVLDSLGLSSLDSLDGQWIAIDHTLINSSLASLNQTAAAATKSTQYPTVAQLQDAITKVESVNKTYLFTTNTSTAVLTNEKYVGNTTLDGRNVDHFQVGYNKAHLESYLSAVASALDDSSLNAWSKAANKGQSLSQELNIDSVKNTVASANTSYRFDIWVDTKTKLPHTIQFVDPSDHSSVFTISQNYTGGTTYPFALGFTGKDVTSGDTENAKINLSFDTSTNKVTAGFTVTDGSSTNLNANFALTPSTQTVQVTPPAGAESITSLVTELGLSGSTGAGL
jgi:hypothetical protein